MKSFRKALDCVLRSAGYGTILFESADAFLRSDRIHQTDCLLVDYQMPGTNGLHFTRKLTDMNHSAPIIMVTMSAEEIREAALKAGAVAVFAKRVSPDVLLDAIRVALEGKQSRRQ